MRLPLCLFEKEHAHVIHVPAALEVETETRSWFPETDEDERRAQSPSPPPQEGAQTPNGLVRLIHDHFCCNRGVAAAKCLCTGCGARGRAGGPLSPWPCCFKSAPDLLGSSRPARDEPPRLGRTRSGAWHVRQRTSCFFSRTAATSSASKRPAAVSKPPFSIWSPVALKSPMLEWVSLSASAWAGPSSVIGQNVFFANWRGSRAASWCRAVICSSFQNTASWQQRIGFCVTCG